MLEGSSPEARLHILEDCPATVFMTRRTPRDWGPHPAVKFALEESKRNSSQFSIADIARRGGWSERRFSEVFREQVGFPPKVWCRLQRFHRAVRQLRYGVEVPWAEMAVECGFYDQAHFANEFRSFSGIDLTTYTARSHRLWANHTYTKHVDMDFGTYHYPKRNQTISGSAPKKCSRNYCDLSILLALLSGLWTLVADWAF
jgi:AraC-like DNA-binding protein